MPTQTSTSKYRRATEYTKGLGNNLDKIEGKDVLVWEWEVERGRKYGEGTNDLVTMQISTVDDEANKQLFHAWSTSLCDRFDELTNADNAETPLIIMFERFSTSMPGQKACVMR